MLKHLFILIAFIFCLTNSLANAADNPLSVHVLNTQDGLPSADVEVTLEQEKNGAWVALSTAKTNQAGRITGLYPEGKALEKGKYRVTFKTGDWFKKRGIESFFPEIPVVFSIDGKLAHYHIPLLLSPYGYSTYRGS